MKERLIRIGQDIEHTIDRIKELQREKEEELDLKISEINKLIKTIW